MMPARTLPSVSVSIHAPRVGCDDVLRYTAYDQAVSIHAPRVGCDRNVDVQTKSSERFQFTHPVWGATLVGL